MNPRPKFRITADTSGFSAAVEKIAPSAFEKVTPQERLAQTLRKAQEWADAHPTDPASIEFSKAFAALSKALADIDLEP